MGEEKRREGGRGGGGKGDVGKSVCDVLGEL